MYHNNSIQIIAPKILDTLKALSYNAHRIPYNLNQMAIKKELSREFGDKQITFVKLSELYEQLGSDDSTETILLSKYAKPYQKSLSNKYPSAQVIAYESTI